MKHSWMIITLLVVVTVTAAVLSGCGEAQAVQASFTVEGMTCESCSEAITDTLSKLDGVETASADHIAGTAQAVIVSPDVSPEQLAAEIEGLGYTVTATETAPVQG
jgi:copper chaperone CopZ